MDKINKIIKTKNYYSIYKSTLICNEAKKIFDKYFKDFSIEIISLKNQTLKLKTKNNFEANEIKMKKNQILELINNKYPNQNIKRISIV